MTRAERKGALYFGLLPFFLSILLHIAYPRGIFTAETSSYQNEGVSFAWFRENRLDWWRTPPFGLLLWFFQRHFESVDEPLVLLNCLLFSLNCSLFFWVGCRLCGSVRRAAIVTGCFLAFQVLSMHVFFLNFTVQSDPLFAEMLFLGCLLAALAVILRREWVWVPACAVTGLAIWLRPAGALVPLAWLPALGAGRPSRLAWGMALLLLWNLSWSSRNAGMYGTFGPGASLNGQLIRHFVVQANPKFPWLDDPHLDRLYKEAAARAYRGVGYELGQPLDWRQQWEATDACFPFQPGSGEPFLVLSAQIPHLHTVAGGLPYHNCPRMFEIDRALRAYVLQVVRNQPTEVARVVLSTYRAAFQWHATPAAEYEVPHRDPDLCYFYAEDNQWLERCPKGSPGMARVFAWVARSTVWTVFCRILEEAGLWFGHFLALLALARCRKDARARLYLLFWGSGALYYAVLALAEAPHLRYSLGGQLPVLAAYLWGLATLLSRAPDELSAPRPPAAAT